LSKHAPSGAFFVCTHQFTHQFEIHHFPDLVAVSNSVFGHFKPGIYEVLISNLNNCKLKN
jgi:hypothetical protein